MSLWCGMLSYNYLYCYKVIADHTSYFWSVVEDTCISSRVPEGNRVPLNRAWIYIYIYIYIIYILKKYIFIYESYSDIQNGHAVIEEEPCLFGANWKSKWLTAIFANKRHLVLIGNPSTSDPCTSGKVVTRVGVASSCFQLWQKSLV